MNRDLLTNVSLKDASYSAMAVIDRLQHENAGVQLAAVAAVFLCACDHYKINAQDVFASTTNVMNHADGPRVEFKAVKAFMAGEWT